METNLKVTDQSEEIAFDDIVGGDNIINIPLFQRNYKWSDRNLSEYWDDIIAIVDETSNSQFLGVLVLVPQNRKVGQPFKMDVVDGQQRLTTCYLTGLAIVSVAAKNGDLKWALNAARSYLLTRRFESMQTNTRLIPSAQDRQQFRKVWSMITTLPSLKDADWQGDDPLPPQSSGPEKGRMLSAFKKLHRWVTEFCEKNGSDSYKLIWDIALGKLSFVTINLRSPNAAPSIFERLNARGEKINISDLVRNEIFARVADDPTHATEIFNSQWEPFVEKFKKREVEFEKILFPYGLTFDPNVTKAELFQRLRRQWGDSASPEKIIKEMDSYCPALFALEANDSSGFSTFDKKLHVVLNDLHQMGAPSSIYSFVFCMTKSLLDGDINEGIVVDILRMIESFLFRRSVVGIEPTGLHAVFKGLWHESGESKLSVDSVSENISRRTTVPWPSDDEFSDAIGNKNLYSRRSAKYALQQYEKSLEGESPKDDFQIEHIYPSSQPKNWGIPRDDESEKLKDTWGNLIPLTINMNPSLSNSNFDNKKEGYKSSIFASAREIAQTNQTWEIENIIARSLKISKWALMRWPHNRFRRV
jgi:hypothetical protein